MQCRVHHSSLSQVSLQRAGDVVGFGRHRSEAFDAAEKFIAKRSFEIADENETGPEFQVKILIQLIEIALDNLTLPVGY